MSDAPIADEMARLGLEPTGPDDCFPIFVQDRGATDDTHEIWLSIVVKGRRVRLCPISAARARFLNKQLAEICWAVG